MKSSSGLRARDVGGERKGRCFWPGARLSDTTIPEEQPSTDGPSASSPPPIGQNVAGARGCRRCVRARETVDTEGGSRVLICAETGKGPRERPDSEDDQLLGMALAVIGPLP